MPRLLKNTDSFQCQRSTVSMFTRWWGTRFDGARRGYDEWGCLLGTLQCQLGVMLGNFTGSLLTAQCMIVMVVLWHMVISGVQHDASCVTGKFLKEIVSPAVWPKEGPAVGLKVANLLGKISNEDRWKEKVQLVSKCSLLHSYATIYNISIMHYHRSYSAKRVG